MDTAPKWVALPRGACGEVFDDISKSMAISTEFARDFAKMAGSVSAKCGKAPGAGDSAAHLPEMP